MQTSDLAQHMRDMIDNIMGQTNWRLIDMDAQETIVFLEECNQKHTAKAIKYNDQWRYYYYAELCLIVLVTNKNGYIHFGVAIWAPSFVIPYNAKPYKGMLELVK